MNQRELVLSMLKEIYAGSEFSHILIRQVLDKYDYLECTVGILVTTIWMKK